MKFNKCRQKNGTSSLRDKIGVTQVELAALLLVNRSVIAMNEIGNRPLPGNAHLKIGLLEINLANGVAFNPEEIHAHPAEQPLDVLINELTAESLAKEATCRKTAAKLQTQLATLTKMYNTPHIRDQKVSLLS